MTLSDLLALLDDVSVSGDGYVARCPTHDDHDPSLRIAVSKENKVMVRCRAACPTPAVLKALGLTMRDLASMVPGAVQVRARSADVPASPEDVARLGETVAGYAEALRGDSAPAAEVLAYAESRFGLGSGDCFRLGLGVATDLDGSAAAVRLVVPFRDETGTARGFQARAMAKDAAVRWKGPASPEGASWERVGILRASSGWDEVLVTEGPGDALTAVSAGYDAVLVSGAGLASSPRVVEGVSRLVGSRMAVIAGDGDAAGRAFSATLAQSLLSAGHRVKILPVPDEFDLTRWRQQSEGDEFITTLVRAIAVTPEATSAEAALHARDESIHPLTDLGNGRLLRDYIAAQKSGVKFSPETGFLLYRGGVWEPDRLDRTRAYAQETAERFGAQARDFIESLPAEPTTEQRKRAARWAKWAAYSQSTRGIDAALKEVSALTDVAVDVNAFDTHHDLLAVANGVVDLRSGTLMPHDPALLLTRRVAIDYDPNATAPRWNSFLSEVFRDHPDLPGYVRRLIGYGITGHTTEQCFAVLWGTGANGKSVFTDTLAAVLGPITVATPFSTFEAKPSGGIPNDLAALKGARLVHAAEGEQGKPMAEAVLKRVTGRDVIAARFMRKEFFEFRPTFLLLLATNSKPNFRGQDEGLWRRVKLIPWSRYFAPSERDHRLGDTLLRERQGILAWAVRGAREWYESGLQDPHTIKAATGEYRATSDALSGFLPGVYLRDPEAGRMLGATVFSDYLVWADEENLPARERWTRRAFFSALEERGYVKRNTKRGVAFENLRRARPTDHALEEGGRAAEPPAALSSVTGARPMSTPARPASLEDVLGKD